MTPEAQRTAIAEACGIIGPFDDRWIKEYEKEGGDAYGFTGFENGELVFVPAYVTDLNAICNAIHTLPSGLRDNTFTSILAMVCGFKAHGVESWSKLHAGRFAVINATAAQRAEAFLRTLGKWEASK